ncbi:MAG: universal stress protein [Rhodocyclaceae bacterium]
MTELNGGLIRSDAALKVLLAHDGSDASLLGVRTLIDFCARLREAPNVHLLFVHPPVPIAFAAEHVSREVLDTYYREEGEQALSAAAILLDEAGLAFTPHIHVGSVAETVVRVAGELGCELICLGTHGRGALSTALLGSVASKVVHLSHVPVLLAKQHAPPPKP